VDDDELGPHLCQAVGNRCRAGVAAVDDLQLEAVATKLPDLILAARGRGDDRPLDARGAAERGEGPGKQRPARNLYEGLRAAGSEPLSGTGGRDDRCSAG
jgi:hypothetical protein